MSFIWEYVTSILPNVSRDTIIDDIRSIQNELKTTTLSSYKDSIDVFKKWTPKSKELIFKVNYFNKVVKSRVTTDSMVENIYKSLHKLDESLASVTECTLDLFNKEVSGVGLSYRKANILQYLEAASFVTSYARTFLIYLYNEDAKSHGSSVDGYDLLRYDVKYINEQWMNFITLIELFNNDVVNKSNFKKTIDNIPDISVSKDNLNTLNTTIGKDKMDPFHFSSISIKWNPIFRIKIKIAEYQAKKYKKALKEREALELRRLLLEAKKDGKENAKLEAQLGFVKDEIDNITRYIDEMEQKNG